MSSQDVHDFDRHWTHDIKSGGVSLADKRILFNALYQDMINLGVEESSIKGLVMIVENIQNSSNFDV